METSEAKAVIQGLVDVIDGQHTALKAEFGARVESVEKPALVWVRSPEIAALKHCLTMLSRYDLHQVSAGWAALDKLHAFAAAHAKSERAATAVMGYLLGKCDHAFVDAEQHCALCGEQNG